MLKYLKHKSSAPLQAANDMVGHRGRLVLKTGSWALVAKICAAINLFLCVPFVMKSLGGSHFGVWATVASMVSLSAFLDFGIGNGAMNLIASAKGREATHEIGQIVRTAYHTVLKITLFLVLGLALVPFLPWHRLLGLSAHEAGLAQLCVFIVCVAVLAALPLNLANRLQLGLGQGNKAFRWQAAGQLASAAITIMLASRNAGLAALVAATTLTPLLTAALNTRELRHDVLTDDRTPHPAEREIANRIQREGLLFFILQLAATLAFSFDLLLISALVGSEQAGQYSIVQRVFSIIPMTLALVWVSLWPTYRQALDSGNHTWVTRTLRHSLFLAMLFAGIVGSVLLFGFDQIMALWVKNPISISGALLSGFALWCVIDAAGVAIATFLNAASIMRYQVFTAVIFAVSCILAKWWMIVNVGIWTIPWTTAAVFLLTSLLPTLLLWRKIMSEAFRKTASRVVITSTPNTGTNSG